MAETLVELVARISADASALKGALSTAEKDTEKSSQKMAQSLKTIGKSMVIAGAAITAAMGLMGKAAIDEEINIKRLATTMKNAGTSYDDVKDSLEAVIATTQRKTGVADNEQRDILNRLILVTNDYKKALNLLPTVLDLAAAGSMDATTAATYLGKAYLELEDGAKEVSVRFGQASLKFKDMEDIQNRVAGSAEALVNPLNVLKASVGDVAETIGAFLIPTVKAAIDKIVDVAIKIQEWVKENPVLAKAITLTAGAVGLLLTAVGGLILLVPKAVGAIKAYTVAMAGLRTSLLAQMILHPIFAAQLVASTIAFYAHAVATKVATAAVWLFGASVAAITIAMAAFLAGIGMIVWAWSTLVSQNKKVQVALDENLKLQDELAKANRGEANTALELSIAILGAVQARKDSGKATKEDLAWLEKCKPIYDSNIAQLTKMREAQTGVTETSKDSTEAQIEGFKRVVNEAKRRANESANSQISAIDAVMKKADIAHNKDMSDMAETYTALVKNINKQLGIDLSAEQAKIDAIDKATTDEELIITKANERKRLAELVAAGDKEAYKEYETEVTRNELLRQRELEKSAIRVSMDALRLDAEKRLEIEETAYNKEVIRLNNSHDALVTKLGNDKAALDFALTEKLTRYDEDLAKYDETLALQLMHLKDFIAQYNVALEGMNRITTGVISPEVSTEGWRPDFTSATPWAGKPTDYGGGFIPTPENPTPPWLAEGGIVTQPTMAMVGEAGPEAIIPLNEAMGNNITINFTQPVFFDREDTMNKFVRLINKGIQRQERLKFGGAYNG